MYIICIRSLEFDQIAVSFNLIILCYSVTIRLYCLCSFFNIHNVDCYNETHEVDKSISNINLSQTVQNLGSQIGSPFFCVISYVLLNAMFQF